MRSGLWTSGSGGSGILIARKTDGTWSPPSGLVLQTPSLGFVIGVDIYDCVLIINNFTVLEAFARPKLTLGIDVTLSPGPLVALGLLENDVTWTDLSDAAITYVKAKGQFSEAAEGRVDYDTALVESLSSQPAPGDATIEPSATPHLSPTFGVPTADDPDPFGVLALEMAGVGIREAGTQLRPESTQFEYHPSPTSPVFPKAKRGSVDTAMSRSNRGSYMSNRTVGTEKSQVTDACTQTFAATAETTPTHSQSQSEDGHQQHSSDEVQKIKEPIEVDYTKIDISSLRMLSNFPDLEEPLPETSPNDNDVIVRTIIDNKSERKGEDESKEGDYRDHSPPSPVDNENEGDADDEEDGNSSIYDPDDDDDDDDVEEGSDSDDSDDELDDEEEPVVFEVATAQAPARVAMVGTQVMQAKGAVVNIPKRVPPPLPVRSPARTSRRRSQMPDISSMVGSPLRKEFDPAEISQGSATPRASKILESGNDAIGDEVSQAPSDAADVDTFENPTDSETTLVPELQERSKKRVSHIMPTSSAAEEAARDFDHKVATSVA
ncbi:hypothetical protein ONZ43_g4513 [Nemania bipapillata]|uniref:Uncharacterized protein n=1 Tax=Nemania bipapillata TaxID=110536 RepID=A0ACC2ILX5_9PEZI|nr:hypothetical protein ONZ43_g4513 [Nemania bipapillata]